jgi:hypothetical protein
VLEERVHGQERQGAIDAEIALLDGIFRPEVQRVIQTGATVRRGRLRLLVLVVIPPELVDQGLRRERRESFMERDRPVLDLAMGIEVGGTEHGAEPARRSVVVVVVPEMHHLVDHGVHTPQVAVLRGVNVCAAGDAVRIAQLRGDDVGRINHPDLVFESQKSVARSELVDELRADVPGDRAADVVPVAELAVGAEREGGIDLARGVLDLLDVLVGFDPRAQEIARLAE